MAQHEARVRELFDSLDAAQQGYIDQRALDSFMLRINPELSEEARRAQIPVLMAQMDTNKDGVIDFEEFAAAVRGTTNLQRSTEEEEEEDDDEEEGGGDGGEKKKSKEVKEREAGLLGDL